MKREEIKWHDRDHTKSADDSLSGLPIWSPAPSAFRIQCPLEAFYCAQTCSSKFHLLTPCQTLLAFPISEPAFRLFHGVGQPKKWFSQLRISLLSVKNFWVPFRLGSGVNQAVNIERKGKMDQTALLPVFFRAKKTWAWWFMPLMPTPERERQVDLCELSVSMIYTQSSRPGQARPRTTWKNNEKEII